MNKKNDVHQETEAQVSEEVAALLSRLKELADERDEIKKAMDGYRFIGPRKGEEKLKRADKPEKGGAYLVTVRRGFWGERMGIQFRDGIGLVPEDNPECEQIAHTLEADMHYNVKPIGSNEYQELLKKLMVLKPPDVKTPAALKGIRQGVIR